MRIVLLIEWKLCSNESRELHSTSYKDVIHKVVYNRSEQQFICGAKGELLYILIANQYEGCERGLRKPLSDGHVFKHFIPVPLSYIYIWKMFCTDDVEAGNREKHILKGERASGITAHRDHLIALLQLNARWSCDRIRMAN